MDAKQQNTTKIRARRGKKWSFAGMRSGTFGAPKGEEKNPSTYTKNVTQPSLDKRKTAASWQWMRNQQNTT